ncbi:hypothetical protein CMV_019136 [Castanea mollissima]|uniref:Uncharacterized protein n=1 Tax=Castanea mollissima TaxID=60419 RepID=A0A8J4VN28_9ROSI|nr:hypothetical protein CMV_019136 [Castanea mollissima]
MPNHHRFKQTNSHRFKQTNTATDSSFHQTNTNNNLHQSSHRFKQTNTNNNHHRSSHQETTNPQTHQNPLTSVIWWRFWLFGARNSIGFSLKIQSDRFGLRSGL